MSSCGANGAGCPMCGDNIGPFGIIKHDDLIDWELACRLCGHAWGKGTYWLSELGGYLAHCKQLNRPIPEFLKGW